jgi:hypothetical protein
MPLLRSVAQDILPNDEVRFDGSFWQVFDTLRTPDGRITLMLDGISEDRGIRVSFAPLDLVEVIDDDADDDDESDPWLESDDLDFAFADDRPTQDEIYGRSEY